MRTLSLILLLFSLDLTAQQETGYWKEADIKYERESSPRRDYSIKSSSASAFAAEAFTKAYWFFISDLDGDNCPFRPSCSEFFSQSVSKTNIFTGTLLFFDRFTRDMNFIDRHKHYEILPDGYYSDPPDKYIF